MSDLARKLPIQYTHPDGVDVNGGGGGGNSSSPQNDYVQRSELDEVAFTGDYGDLVGKPTLGTAAAKDVPASGNASTTQVVMGNDSRLTNSRPASDVSAWAKASTKPSYTKSEVGLGNVGNFKAVSTAASQGLTNTEKSNAKANIGLDNVDNTSDAAKKTMFSGSLAEYDYGFVTGHEVYNALQRFKTIEINSNNYTSNLFNNIMPGDTVYINFQVNMFSSAHGASIDIKKCHGCFIYLEDVSYLAILTYNNSPITVDGDIPLEGRFLGFLVTDKLISLSNSLNPIVLSLYKPVITNNNITNDYSSNYTPILLNISTDSDTLDKVKIHLYYQNYFKIISGNTKFARTIKSFGDINNPGTPSKCSSFGYFPLDDIDTLNNSSWETLFVGCSFFINTIIKIKTSKISYNKAFYYAFGYSNTTPTIDLTESIITDSNQPTDLTSCFESAEYFNVILDGVDLTNNICTNMFKNARYITISAIGCNQDTIDKINANISGSHTSTITVITTDPNV